MGQQQDEFSTGVRFTPLPREDESGLRWGCHGGVDDQAETRTGNKRWRSA